MTKGEMISLLQDKLSGGSITNDTKKRWHPEIIGHWIELVLADLVSGVTGDALHYSDFVQLDWFIKAFEDVDVTLDAERSEYYAIFPKQPARLPGNAGVRLISGMTDQKHKYVLRSNNTESIYGHLEINSKKNRITYYIENDRVFFDKDAWVSSVTHVLMKLILVSGLEDEDELQIPAGKGAQFIDTLFKLIVGKLPQDQKDDLQIKQEAQ
jgi:hypothetical protein